MIDNRGKSTRKALHLAIKLIATNAYNTGAIGLKGLQLRRKLRLRLAVQKSHSVRPDP